MKKATLGFGLMMLISSVAHADLLQILHTNDLHSHLDHAVHRPELGGYGRVKVLLDKYRKEAADQNIGTIAMDGGDFLEGNLYYMADNGRKSAMAYNRLGYDVAVLGNHDYLMGAQDLENLLRDVPPSMNMLSANFDLDDNKYPEVKEHIKPVWETVVSGVKVGVIGITLNDMLYKWRLKGDGSIKSEVDAAKYYAKYLRDRGNEVIVALTHIGVTKDKWLAINVPELDLIVGGHSHTELHQVVYQTSKNGKKIPIVQAGKFGEWIGKLMLDYDRKTKKLKVLEYKLHPVYSETKDEVVQNIISDANNDLDELYGREWLQEVVGRSFLRSAHEHKEDVKTWNFFINDAMLEAAHADFAIHTTALSGDNFPIGDVTRRSIYNGNPRHFELENKYGYNVYTAKVNGMLIKLLATACLNLNAPLYFSGITFKWKQKANGKYKVWDVRHKGEKIKFYKQYKIALSEAIIRGGFGISKWVGLLLRSAKNENIPMWFALENKFRREGDLHADYLDRYYRNEVVGLFGSREMERVLVLPGEAQY